MESRTSMPRRTGAYLANDAHVNRLYVSNLIACSAEDLIEVSMTNDKEKLKLLQGALHALRERLPGTEAEKARRMQELPEAKEMLVVPIVAHHAQYLMRQHADKTLLCEGLVAIAGRLQATFERLMERIAVAATVISQGEGASAPQVSRREVNRLVLLAQEYKLRIARWDAVYIEQKVEDLKGALLRLIDVFCKFELNEEETVMRLYEEVGRLRESLFHIGGTKMAQEFFCSQFESVGHCLIKHLEAYPFVITRQAIPLHNVLLIINEESPRFPVVDMQYVGGLWCQLKAMGADEADACSMELQTLRAVLDGIAGGAVVALYDVWLMNAKHDRMARQ